MSLNRFGNKTLTAEDDLDVDKINITGEGIGFNDNFGSAGQIIKKSPIDNTIGWFQEQSFTTTEPITINSNVIGFNTQQGATKIATSIETLGSDLSRKLEIGNNGTNNYIMLQELNGLVECSLVNTNNLRIFQSGDIEIAEGVNTLKVQISKSFFHVTSNNYSIGLSSNPIHSFIGNNLDLLNNGVITINSGTSQNELFIDKDRIEPDTSNTNFIIGTTNNPINEIVSNTQNCKVELIVGTIATGNTIDINSNGLSGYSNHATGAHITNFNSITLHSNSPSPDFIGINSKGRGIYTEAGNINLYQSQSNSYGNIVRTGEITGKAGADRYSMTGGAVLNDFGDITSRRYNGDIFNFKNMTDTTTGTTKISISGNSNNIDGDGSTTITNMASIHVSTINNSTLNSANINVSQDLDVTGVITGTDTAIFTNGFKQAVGLGTFHINPTGDLTTNSLTTNNIVATTIQAGSQTITGNISMSNNDILCKAISITGGANSGIDMNGADITEVGNITMNNANSNLNMNNGNITNVNNINVSDIGLTNQLTISKNVDIRWEDDVDLTTKYSCNFVISTEAHPAGTGAFEREFWNECWMVGNRYEGFGTQMPFSPDFSDFNGNLSGIRQTGTGMGSSGGFMSYPHFLFTGSYPPAGSYSERKLVSKIFPVNAFRDVVKIQFRVIGGNNSNGGANLDSKTRLFFCWDQGTNGNHRTYNLPQDPVNDTSGNYFHRLYSNSNGNTISNWITLSLTTTSYDGQVVPDFTSTQLTNFMNARSFMLYNVNDGSTAEIGITDFKMFSVNQKNGLLTNNIDKVSRINDKYMTGNCYRNGSIYGALSYYGLNYCNGWYYEELDMSKWIADDDSSSPSSLMVREPPATFSGSTNNTGGFVCLSNHTQVYYCFNCPPGYRVVGYFISLKGNNGTITNPTLASSTFYNHLLQVDNFGQSTETGNTTSKCFLVSESTGSNGTPSGNTNTGISYRSFNVEIPIQTNHALTGTESHKILSNGFPNNIEEYGSRNQLREDKKYKIMCFRQSKWNNGFIFTGGYIKYQKWDGETL